MNMQMSGERQAAKVTTRCVTVSKCTLGMTIQDYAMRGFHLVIQEGKHPKITLVFTKAEYSFSPNEIEEMERQRLEYESRQQLTDEVNIGNKELLDRLKEMGMFRK